jgi:hypothetical protein
MSLKLESVVRDLRYAVRHLVRARMFAAAIVLTLAAGIGCCTAVFSVVDRILFRSLPYRDDDRLVSFGMMAPVATDEFLLGYDYLEWRDGMGPFESHGAYTGAGDCDLTERYPVRLRCARVDFGLLPTLGVRPVVGRAFTRDEDRPLAPKVALISFRLWRSRFARDPGAIGKGVSLDGQLVTLVGVLPREFEIPDAGLRRCAHAACAG